MLAMNLTPKQLRILKLIRDWRVRRGYSPTMQELADEIGVSKVTVFEHVEALIKKGALVREPNKARSLSIAEGVAVPDEDRPLRFPLVGKIAAGYPIEKVADRTSSTSRAASAREGPGRRLHLRPQRRRRQHARRGHPRRRLRPRRAGPGRQERRPRRRPAPDGSTTLKTFYKEDDHIRLQPANPDFEPIRVKVLPRSRASSVSAVPRAILVSPARAKDPVHRRREDVRRGVDLRCGSQANEHARGRSGGGRR
jgi:repressor LexA